MHPILFHAGDLSIHTYGLMGAAAFLLVSIVGILRCRTLGIVPDRAADVVFWTSLAALIGARAVFVLQNPEAIGGPSDWLKLRTGGLVFYGALVAGLPAASLVMWRHQMPFYATWDAFATALPLGHALTRLGCLAAGCCYGSPTHLPWGVRYEHALAAAPRGVPLHPVQVYEAAWLVVIGMVANALYARKRFHGQVTLTYLSMYAGGRAVLETWRGDPERGRFLPSVLGDALSWSQGMSVVVAATGLLVFLWGARRARS